MAVGTDLLVPRYRIPSASLHTDVFERRDLTQLVEPEGHRWFGGWARAWRLRGEALVPNRQGLLEMADMAL